MMWEMESTTDKVLRKIKEKVILVGMFMILQNANMLNWIILLGEKMKCFLV